MPQLLERNAVAKRQDLSNVIHVADVKKTPFFTSVKKGTQPTNTLCEWPVDSFPAPKTTGAIDEADVKRFENLSAVDAVIQGRLQIFERAPKVSRMAQIATNQAGVGIRKAFARAVAKGLIMIARDIETTALSDNDSRLGTGTQGAQMRGMGKWISTTQQGDLPVDKRYLTPAGAIYTGTLSALTDDDITAVMQAIYDQTGDDDMLLTGFCGSLAKRAISRLTQYTQEVTNYVSVRRYNQTDGTVLENKVDIIKTDFGTVALRLSSFINTGGDPTSAASKLLSHWVNMDTCSMRFAENPNSEELPNLGGGPRALIQAVGTLQVGNPLFNGGLQPSGA